MSSLAVNKPFLRNSENLRRRALFTDVAEHIAELIDERANTASQERVPHWLQRLITIWHIDRSTVITLNYDTLVERAARSVSLDCASKGPISPSQLMKGLPPAAPEGITFGDGERETFGLLKLHGSTNFYGRPASSDLFSVVRIDSEVGVWGPEKEPRSSSAQAFVDSLDQDLAPRYRIFRHIRHGRRSKPQRCRPAPVIAWHYGVRLRTTGFDSIQQPLPRTRNRFLQAQPVQRPRSIIDQLPGDRSHTGWKEMGNSQFKPRNGRTSRMHEQI